MSELRQLIDRFLLEASRILYDWRYGFGQFWAEGSNREFILSLAALASVAVALFLMALHRGKEMALLKEISQGLVKTLAAESLASLFFGVLFKAVRVPAAAFYLAHSSQGPFVMKAKQLNADLAPGPATEWEPPPILEDIPGEPGAVRKGAFAVFSFPVTLGAGHAAVVTLALERSQDERRIKARVPFLITLFVPILSQLAGLDKIRRLEEQNREASVVLSSSQILLSATVGPDQLADLLLDLAVRSTESDAGLILAGNVEPEERKPQILASKGLASLLSQELGAELRAPDLVFTAASRVMNPLDSDSRFCGVLHGAGFRSLVQAPIAVDGETLGAVMLLKKDKAFYPGHIRVCELNAGRLAFTFKNRRYHEEVFAEYKETLKALVHTMESSASHLTGHSLRVAWIAGALARELNLPAAEIEGIQLAGELHDIGMVGLSEEILLKPGRLTSQEYDLVTHHPLVGASLTAPIRLPLPIGRLILHHHERHDGFGYPEGLKGDAIPLGAKILALGEVFDALVSSRSYRQGLPIAEALEKLRSLAGTQLDPAIVERFITMMNGSQGRAYLQKRSEQMANPHEA